MDRSSCAVRQASWMHAGTFCMISALSTRLLNHQWHMRTHSLPPSPLSSPHMQKRSSLCTALSTETYGMDRSVWSLDTVLDGPDFPTLDLMYVPPHIFSLAPGPRFLQLYLPIAPHQIGLIQLGRWWREKTARCGMAMRRGQTGPDGVATNKVVHWYQIYMVSQYKSNAWMLTCINVGEHHCLWVLHQPWPRVLQASSLLAGLSKPLLQNSRHWSPGGMVRERTGVKCCNASWAWSRDAAARG